MGCSEDVCPTWSNCNLNHNHGEDTRQVTAVESVGTLSFTEPTWVGVPRIACDVDNEKTAIHA